MSEQEQPREPLSRHVEAKLARDLGDAPVVELKGMVKVRAGRVVGIFIGPHDMAEMLTVAEFNTRSALVDGSMQVGVIHGTPVFLLGEDLP
jgi:hypothetical protein